MMGRIPLRLGILLWSFALPVVAHAYITPEEALNDSNFTTQFFTPPPSPRTTQDVVQQQQDRSAQRRAAEQAAIMPQSSSASSDDTQLHDAAPDQAGGTTTDTSGGVTQDPSTMTEDQLRDARLLERIKADQMAAAQQAALQALLGNQTLHSGAPLAHTGPATFVVALAIVAAIGETWRRVRKAEKTM
jgi:hypothetical protein